MCDGKEVIHDYELVQIERFRECGPGECPGTVRKTDFLVLRRPGDSENGKARSRRAKSGDRFAQCRDQVLYVVILIRFAPQQSVRAADGNTRIRAANIGD